MGLLDYHAKYLLPTVWDSDGMGLRHRFVSQLENQLDRFPYLRDAFLVGDAVSHYWRDDSDVDVILHVPDAYVAEAQREASMASGYPFSDSANRLFLYPVSTESSPSVVAQHFGPLHSVVSGLWYGTRLLDEMELRRPGPLLQRINWMLYKSRLATDPFPYKWRIVKEAYSRLNPDERVEVLDDIRYRVKRLDRSITKAVRHYPKAVWKDLERFEDELAEEEEVVDNELPPRLVYLVLHRFRYHDILDTLIELEEKLSRRENRR